MYEVLDTHSRAKLRADGKKRNLRMQGVPHVKQIPAFRRSTNQTAHVRWRSSFCASEFLSDPSSKLGPSRLLDDLGGFIALPTYPIGGALLNDAASTALKDSLSSSAVSQASEGQHASGNGPEQVHPNPASGSHVRENASYTSIIFS